MIDFYSMQNELMSIKSKLNLSYPHIFLLRLLASYGGRIQVETSFFCEILSFFFCYFVWKFLQWYVHTSEWCVQNLSLIWNWFKVCSYKCCFIVFWWLALGAFRQLLGLFCKKHTHNTVSCTLCTCIPSSICDDH